jgi:GTP:adenosylcobinamide-phosphate guanylyltransferase
LNVAGHQSGSTFGEKCSLNIDAIKNDTENTLDSAIAVIDANVDLILADTADIQPKLGTPVTSVAADIAAVKAETANIVADTAVIGTPVSSVAADIAAVKAETANIVADTAEIGAAGAGLTVLATASALTTVDTVVDAIKAKTDSLTFTKANEVDANAQSINGVTLTGDGSTTPFDVV